MANEQVNQQERQLLPISDLHGIEYFVDIDRRQFRAVNDAKNTIDFYTAQGRDMVNAMLGTEWRKHGIDNSTSGQTSEEICTRCGCKMTAARA